MSEVATTAAVATEHAPEGGAFDVGEHIMHHILDSNTIEVPFTSYEIHLPQLHVGKYDLSITRNVVMMWIACAILLALFVTAGRRAKKGGVPKGMTNALEAMVLYVRNEIARKTIDPHYADRYVGYLCTAFFFILACNLLGMIPGMSTPTSSISVTATLALFTFVISQGGGIRNYGVFGHFKNLVPHGLPVAILPVILVVEIISMLARPFALAIRLFANMTAGHVVIISLISLIFVLKSVFVAGMSVPFALFVYTLEILVAFLQAFIFTMLSSLFIGLAVHPSH
ncbi:MAG TPA: F0F1 ATP synthase subunit A [Candidatus Polarisedimenticolaceae bacterium]|nr:F0F1 ATP synthase subunit A [Candidatus Polarisedimenticolaceae bacterium]